MSRARARPHTHTHSAAICLVYDAHSSALFVLLGPADKCAIEGNDCTFVSDLSKIELHKNSDTLGQKRNRQTKSGSSPQMSD